MFVEATAEYYHPGKWTVSQLIMEFGSTKKVGEALGVTQRQVQRYLQYEKGSTDKQARSTKRVQGKIDALGKQFEKPKEARGKEGITIKVDGRVKVRSSKKKKQDDERDREIDLELSDEEWEELVRKANEEGEEAAQEYFFEELYGVAGMSLLYGEVDAV